MPLTTGLLWLLLLAALFVGFTVQGAMWRACQERHRNGWVCSLIWTVATAIAIGAIQAADRIWFCYPR